VRKTCESCARLAVQPEPGKEYSVLLVDQVANFVEPTCPVDVYPPQMWDAAAQYFEEKDVRLPGGRYACAQALVAMRLPFLQDRSLGEVCHIVQLSLTYHRLLGYRDGQMVPFGQSVDCVRAQCAVRQQPMSAVSKKAEPELPAATWGQARACMWRLLLDAGSRGRPGAVSSSNIKRLFRSRFGLDLSETSLGHLRLHELLQDRRFSDIIMLEMRGSTPLVKPRRQSCWEGEAWLPYTDGFVMFEQVAEAAPDGWS